MAEINVSRWLLGGVVAGIVIWLLEGVGGLLYMDQAQTSLERLCQIRAGGCHWT